jgi:glutamate/tyrosine decarboxylase-like PLP-dependent enzyme
MTAPIPDQHRALRLAFEHALRFLDSLPQRPTGATADRPTLRRQLGRPLPDQGVSAETVIQDLIGEVDGGLLASTGGRFFGWVIGGALPAALAADWLAGAWDQNAALYACAPAAAVAEEVVGEWLKELLGLPRGASFALVSGCQMAHATCLAAARHALLARRGWDVETRGLAGAPNIRVLTSAHRHGSIERAVRLLGLGSSALEDIASDARDRLDPTALETALRARPNAPAIVLLQAGDINVGAFDPFDAVIPMARRAGAWVHVDGAFGLWAAASPTFRHLARGVETADSWATDGHKWLNVPFDCGYAFVADPAAHRAAMSHRASYLTHDDEARDQIDWNPEWSRRARGFPTYAAIRQLGRAGIADLVECCCRHAHALVTGIGRLPGAALLWEPTLNQGLVRFPDPSTGATEDDHDRHTDRVIEAVVASGDAFFGGTTWRGRRAMRISVCGWRTTDDDVRRAVAAVESAMRRVRQAA